jgi:hypothetical protein
MFLIVIVLVACWALTVGPEPSSVHIFSNWCKSLAHFCPPFPLSMQDILPRAGDCLGVDELLMCKAESGCSPKFPRFKKKNSILKLPTKE